GLPWCVVHRGNVFRAQEHHIIRIEGSPTPSARNAGLEVFTGETVIVCPCVIDHGAGSYVCTPLKSVFERPPARMADRVADRASVGFACGAPCVHCRDTDT